VCGREIEYGEEAVTCSIITDRYICSYFNKPTTTTVSFHICQTCENHRIDYSEVLSDFLEAWTTEFQPNKHDYECFVTGEEFKEGQEIFSTDIGTFKDEKTFWDYIEENMDWC